MAFPDDLSNVVVFKIHPAIGIARVANNDDHFVFGADPGTYRSNETIKRQAVQFRVFAYGENHVGLGELTTNLMSKLGITAVWSAKLANRKIAFYSNEPLSSTNLVFSGEARSDDANDGKLVGKLPTFAEGGTIPMGQITGTGLFIPPKGGVFRKTSSSVPQDYPARSKDVADTSCDGPISVELKHSGTVLSAIPASVLVSPPDFSPDIDPRDENNPSLFEFLSTKLQIDGSSVGNIHNQTALSIDRMHLQPCTADFAPGFEASLGSRGEVPNIPSIFYKTTDPTSDPREIRIKYKAIGIPGPGAIPGQLTSGLCSTWQGDFTACVGYWTENLPLSTHLDEDTSREVLVFRKKYADFQGETLEVAEDFVKHVDKTGIVRNVNGKLVETERNPGDDM